ncbi:MAG: serine hydrolase domain-containing protein [Caldilineaceae bacterium]
MNQRLQLLTVLCLLLLLNGCSGSAGEDTPQAPPTATARPTVVPPTVTTSQPVRAILPAVDAVLKKLVEQQQFSGAVLIAQAGALLVNKGYGFADRAKQLPNTPQTKFRLGSLTKQFTALAMLQLQAQGKLNVQDPICKYLTDCPATWQAMTIHQLLTHTSGIPDLTHFPDYERIKTTPSTPAQTIARFKAKPLDFQPGAKWDYSNSNYIVLGAIIERASGKSYEQFLQENIFIPLQMNSSGYEHDKTMLATGYANATAEAELIDMSIPFAAGGLYSTVEDLYRWDQALYTEKLLPAHLRDQLFMPFATIPDSGGLSYGYGWVIGQQFNHLTFSHNGGIEGFVSSINRFPAEKVTLIVLCNQQDTNPNALIASLASIIFTEK